MGVLRRSHAHVSVTLVLQLKSEITFELVFMFAIMIPVNGAMTKSDFYVLIVNL